MRDGIPGTTYVEDLVGDLALAGEDGDRVACLEPGDLMERCAVRTAAAKHPGPAGLAGQRCVAQVPRPGHQVTRRGAVDDDLLQVDGRNREERDRRTRLERLAAVVQRTGRRRRLRELRPELRVQQMLAAGMGQPTEYEQLQQQPG